MRKKKLYLSQIPPSKGGEFGRFIPALMGEVVFLAIEKFGLPGQVAELPLIDIFTSYHIEKDTIIRPMSASPAEVIDAVNRQSGIYLTVEEVDIVGIDIGNESTTWLLPKGNVYGITGTPAMRYKNPSHQILLPWVLKDSEYELPARHRYSQYHSLMNALAILKAYVPTTNQETPT